jgi:hypothetical protein
MDTLLIFNFFVDLYEIIEPSLYFPDKINYFNLRDLHLLLSAMYVCEHTCTYICTFVCKYIGRYIKPCSNEG